MDYLRNLLMISTLVLIFSSLVLTGCLEEGAAVGYMGSSTEHTELAPYLQHLLRQDAGFNLDNLTTVKFDRASEDLFVVSIWNIYPRLKSSTVYITVQNTSDSLLSATSFFEKGFGDMLYHTVIVKTGERVETEEQALSFASKYLKNPPESFEVQKQESAPPMFLSIYDGKKVAVVSDSLEPANTYLFVLEPTKHSEIDVSKA